MMSSSMGSLVRTLPWQHINPSTQPPLEMIVSSFEQQVKRRRCVLRTYHIRFLVSLAANLRPVWNYRSLLEPCTFPQILHPLCTVVIARCTFPLQPGQLTNRSLETSLQATNVTETQYFGRYLPLHNWVVISTLPASGVSLQNPLYKGAVYPSVSAEGCADRSDATHTRLWQPYAGAATVSHWMGDQSPDVSGEGLARTALKANGKAQKRESLIF
jgi:hypothetical protein